MKYKTLKSLPGIEVGTVFEYNKDIITGQHGVTLTLTIGELSRGGGNSIKDNIGGLFEFIEGFGLDNDFFEKVEEKRKVVPVEGDKHYIINSYGDIECMTIIPRWQYQAFDQGNWRWTIEEAQKEVARRSAIERVRRYIVSNGLLEEDKDKSYNNIRIAYGKLGTYPVSEDFSYYSPYGRLKDTDLTQFIEDCREDLMTIHSN